MKKFMMILFSFLLLNNLCFSQSEWFWLNPTPTGNNINAAELLGNDTIIIVGDGGMMLRSINFGQNWYPIFSNVSVMNTIQDIRRISSRKLLITGGSGEYGGSGIILLSTNLGANWTNVYSSSYNINRIFNLDSNVIYAVGYYNILKSSNGGSSWSNIFSLTAYGTLTGIHFINSSTGFSVGYNTVYSGWPPTTYTRSLIVKTTNAGSTWKIDSMGNGFKLSDIYFLTPAKGYMVSSNGYLYKTYNSGLNWQSQLISNIELNRLCVLDSNNIYIAGASLAKTTNAGVNWVFYGINGKNISISKTRQKGVVVGSKGVLNISSNNGNTWVNLRKGFYNNYDFEYIKKVHFVNSKFGMLMTSSGYSHVYKTTNGGINWVLTSLPLSGPMNEIYCLDSNTAFALGNNATICKTTNFGLNWSLGQHFASNDIEGVTFINSNTGFTVGDYGFIAKTTNRGNNWNVTNFSTDYYRDVSFYGINDGVIVGAGQGGAILWTTNCGSTWMTRNSGLNNTYTAFNGVWMLNATTAVIADRDHRILKTTNSGVNWRIVYSSSTSFSYNDVCFFNTQNGIVVGSNGVIVRTSNGGENWYLQQSNTTDDLYGCSLKGSNNYVAVGENYCILTTQDINVIGICYQSNNIPHSYSLFQNYPNPFNPVTKIKYDIPPEPATISSGKGARGMIVRLIIYDVLGREIETLVNQTQKPGSYEVTWDGSRFASGVYFYRLITDDFTETKKMVLIK